MTGAPTTCESCRRAELTPWQRLTEDIRARFAPPGGRMLAQWASASSNLIGAFSGPSAPTAYELHRQRWVESGDEQELIRMARHV